MSPRRILGLVVAALGGAALSGCGPVAVTGDFDGVGFFADRTAVALLDRHDLSLVGGELIAVQRPEASQSLTLVLTGAVAPDADEWRRLPADRLLGFKKELATKDGVYLEGIPLADVEAGAHVELALDESGRTGDGAFSARLVVGLPDEGAVREQGLGATVNVKVLFDEVRLEPGGQVSGEVEVKRSRSEGQSGEVATGEVVLRFLATLLPERVGKSNLSLVRPVMACAAEKGPVRAGTCRDEPPDPIVDATGTVRGP